MKEIKFRAWDKTNHCWIYSDHQEGLMWFFELLEQTTGKIARQGYELMQYTGLKDKNGKEIYEGDILTDWGFGGKFETVKFLHGKFNPSNSFTNYEKDIMTYEVIGNIYENPELLEECK